MTDQQEPPLEPHPEVKPFAQWLITQSSGRTHDELSENLHQLIARVRDTGKKGSLALIVKVALHDKDACVLVVTDEIKLRLPEHDRKASIWYADHDGNLTKRDPNQLDLFDQLVETPRPTAPDPNQLRSPK